MTEDLERRPVIDEVDKRRLDLIRKTVAVGCTDAEIASFLELAARYDLDPFAKEVWCAKSPGRNGAPGRLLIMVGRDGLRKIAERNDLMVDCDVVREKDIFHVKRLPNRTREVFHDYQGTGERGDIVGAWCEVWDRLSREQRGFFYAPLSEYMPANVSQYSPWANQTSAMILGAAERQAIRQATPLGGLVHEGEADRNLDAGTDALPELSHWELPPAVRAVVEQARQVGHAALSDVDTVAMHVAGRDDEYVARWVADAMDELTAERARYPLVAVEGGGGTTVPVTGDGEPAGDVQPVDPDREAAEPFDEEKSLQLDTEAAAE